MLDSSLDVLLSLVSLEGGAVAALDPDPKSKAAERGSKSRTNSSPIGLPDCRSSIVKLLHVDRVRRGAGARGGRPASSLLSLPSLSSMPSSNPSAWPEVCDRIRCPSIEAEAEAEFKGSCRCVCGAGLREWLAVVAE